MLECDGSTQSRGGALGRGALYGLLACVAAAGVSVAALPSAQACSPPPEPPPEWRAPEDVGGELCEGIDAQIEAVWPGSDEVVVPTKRLLVYGRAGSSSMLSVTLEDDGGTAWSVGLEEILDRGGDRRRLYVLSTDALLEEGAYTLEVSFEKGGVDGGQTMDGTTAVRHSFEVRRREPSEPPVDGVRPTWRRITYDGSAGLDGCRTAREFQQLLLEHSPRDTGLLYYRVNFRAIHPPSVEGWDPGSDARYTFATRALTQRSFEAPADMSAPETHEFEYALGAEAHCLEIEGVERSGISRVLYDSCHADGCGSAHIEDYEAGTEHPFEESARQSCQWYDPYPFYETPEEHRDDETSYECEPFPEDDPYLEDPDVEEGPISSDEPDEQRRNADWGGCACASVTREGRGGDAPLAPLALGTALLGLWTARRRRAR